MKFFQIDDTREILPIGCRLLMLCGLPRSGRVNRRFWLLCVFFFVFGQIPRFLIKIDKPIALVRVGAEIVYSTYIFLQLIALYARRSDLYRLIDTLQECVENPYPDDVRAFILSTRDTINKSSVMYSKCFLAASISYIVMPFMATSAVVVRNRRNQTGEREEYVMPTEMNFYYLDIRFNLLHYSLYFGAVSGLSLTGSLALCTKDVLDFSLIRTVSMLFQATAQQIRNLPPGASQAKLEAIIHSHRSTLKCAAQLQNALNPALLIQITFCTAIWCLMLFYILMLGFTSKVLNVSLLLLILTYETYSYCHLGTQFTSNAEEVLDALQQLAWYDQSIPIQKQIYFMIHRSQTRIQLTAGKLFPVNIAQFSEIVKKSYSFYLVLKDIF